MQVQLSQGLTVANVKILPWYRRFYFSRWAPFAFLVFVLGYGYFNESLFTNPFGLFEKSEVDSQILKTVSFQFQATGSELGLNHSLTRLDPHPMRAHIPHYSAVYGGIAVGDINNDGEYELFFPRVNSYESDLLYVLDESGVYQDRTEEFFSDIESGNSTSAVFFDFNKDGYVDLYIGRIGCDKLYLSRQGKGFYDASHEVGIDEVCNWTASVALLDYNNDGFPDIYLSNYHPSPGIKSARDYGETAPKIRLNRNGGRNVLLKNRDGKELVDVSKKMAVDDSGYTFATGLGDFNLDGKTDLLIANDYGRSQIYLNQFPEKFLNKSEDLLGFVPRSSMSASVGDVNNDGVPDIYEANVSDPGMSIGRNALFMSKRGRYVNQAQVMGVDRCGFGWGTRFFDSDNDGLLDLVAVTGYWDDGPKDYWYNFLTINTFPPFLRRNPRIYPTSYGTHFANERRSCLFINRKGRYIDVGREVGLGKVGIGRGVATFDKDNDGRVDIIAINENEAPGFFENKFIGKEKQNNWLGLKLVGSESTFLATGAKIFVDTGKTRFVRELYSTNGYSSQSDPRVVLGLGRQKSTLLKIIFPSGVEINKKVNQVNKYITVFEKDGRKNDK